MTARLSALPGSLMAGWGFQSTFPERSGDQLFAEFVILYGASCQTGNCPNVQKTPVVTFSAPVAEIYRPRPLAGLLRKGRPFYAAPVIILTAPEAKKEETK